MRIYLFVLLLCLITGCTAVTTEPTPTPIPLPPTTDAIWIDASQMAEDLGISAEEAVRRVQSQDSIGTLNAALEANEAETFGGLWIEHEPTYKVVAAFTENGEETIRPYLQGSPVADQIELREVEYSFAELRSVQTAVSNQLQEAKFPVSSAVNVKENTVEIYVTDEALFNEALTANNIELPESVNVEIVYEPLGKDIPFAVTPVPDVFMPQLRVASSAFMEALLPGTLTVEDGCLRVVSDNGDSYLVIWQPDYFLNDNDGQIEVLNRRGEVVAQVNEPIQMGGGEVSQLDESQLKEPIPGACDGPYWLMGEIVP